MAELTQDQFDLIAKLIRARAAPKIAALMILVEGKTNKEVIAKTGLSGQSLSNTLGRFRRAHKSITSVYLTE